MERQSKHNNLRNIVRPKRVYAFWRSFQWQGKWSNKNIPFVSSCGERFGTSPRIDIICMTKRSCPLLAQKNLLRKVCTLLSRSRISLYFISRLTSSLIEVLASLKLAIILPFLSLISPVQAAFDVWSKQYTSKT